VSRRTELEQDAARAGLEVHTYSPGDGTTRYRFFEIVPGLRQDYFGPRNGITTALGLKEAEAFIAGYLTAG
jgi:hypothetical protein